VTEIELIASYWTIAGAAYPHTDRECSPFGFRNRVEAAAKAGFKGIGLWHADLAHILRGSSLREMKHILDDNGMKHVELEFLTDWFSEGERKIQSDALRKNLLTAAEVLEARHIKVGNFSAEQHPMPRLIEAFKALCAEGEDHGTRIVFEVMPAAMIKTIGEALTMIEGANAENGGIIIDLWHMVRLGIPYDEIGRIPSRYLLAVELNDGDLETPLDLHDATINHRKLCGDGEFDISGFIDCLRKSGYNGPYGIEVLSEDLRPLPLEELATRSFNSTMKQFHPSVK
jgi:sugar phosphate isomerase/epimerase